MLAQSDKSLHNDNAEPNTGITCFMILTHLSLAFFFGDLGSVEQEFLSKIE